MRIRFKETLFAFASSNVTLVQRLRNQRWYEYRAVLLVRGDKTMATNLALRICTSEEVDDAQMQAQMSSHHTYTY